MTVAILVAISLPGLVRAQSDADAAPVILLHPGVATVFQLPGAIAHARIRDRGEIRIAVVGDELFLRPRPGTPAGMRVSLEVETRAARWTFQLVVVARARDANRNVQVPLVDAPAPEDSTPEAPPDEPAEPQAPPLAVTPEIAEPAASAPISAASTEPITASQPAERVTEAAGARRFDLSAYLVMGLGVTSLAFAGYEPSTGFQPHGALGIRLAGERPGEWWALEAELSAESLAGPLVYSNLRDPDLRVSGPWVRAMLGARAQRGIRWRPSVYAGIGAHAQLREAIGSPKLEGAPSSTLAYGGVLALGVGLQYRTRHISLGFDVQVRLGELDEYRSITAFLTVGRVLEEEKEP